MKKFSELGISVQIKSFQGDSISIDRITNTEIEVLDYKIGASKYPEKGSGKCLTLQLKYKGELRVVFSGSSYLMETIESINKEDFPFKTTIVKINKHYEFS